MRQWAYNPDSGGVKIPAAVQARITERVNRYAQANYQGRYTRLDIRFRGALCYIDAYVEPAQPNAALLKVRGETRDAYLALMRNTPLHLCRLRYRGDEEAWSLAFYTYSHERYELACFPSGEFHGTVEAAFDVSAVYLGGE